MKEKPEDRNDAAANPVHVVAAIKSDPTTIMPQR